MDLHEIFMKCWSWPQSQGDLILKVIQIDPHCHLEVTVAQQFISTAAYRNGKRYGWRYYRTIIRSRMCFVQWGHPQWPWSTCQGQTAGNDVSPAREIYVCGMQRPPTTVSHMFSLHEKLSLEILALVEVCILWVLAIFFWKFNCWNDKSIATSSNDSKRFWRQVPRSTTSYRKYRPGGNPAPPRLGILTLTDPWRGVPTLTLTDPNGENYLKNDTNPYSLP